MTVQLKPQKDINVQRYLKPNGDNKGKLFVIFQTLHSKFKLQQIQKEIKPSLSYKFCYKNNFQFRISQSNHTLN